MVIPSANSSVAIHSSMDLEDVFLYFLPKFEALPKGPRSVAEARITLDELEALTRWLCERWEFSMWCESVWQVENVAASPQEMCGGLLLIFASEVCRDRSNEDSVWPTITALLRANKGSFPTLFVGGQPTSVCKNALVAGTRRLGLRNLIDRYGTQEYFDTLKLQFGFTFKGANRRLPEWLDGLGLPIAVKILTGAESEYGDLKSSSFSDLWKALNDFRRSRASQDQTSAFLQTSPWIRSDWTADILKLAKLRTARTFNVAAPTETVDPSSEPLCEPILRWENSSLPQLFLRINEERIYEILGEADTAIFAIDGRIVDRWTAQEGGGWRRKSELPCQPDNTRPNLRPKLLSISSEGKLLEEIDLLLMGTGEPLIIFDLGSGTTVDPGARLDPRRDYALICDTDLSVPDAARSLKFKDRSAYRLAGPWRRDVIALSDGIPYWQPNIGEREPLAAMHLTLESLPDNTAEVGSVSHVRVTGVPCTAVAVSLIVGRSTHVVTKRGAVWQTECPVSIDLGIALGDERVRVRVTGADYSRKVTPKLSLNLRGVACRDTGSDDNAEPQWTLVSRNLPLNRADGSGRARIFAGTMRSQLYEGARLVTRISSRTVPLRDLFGWGSQLIALSAGSSELALVGSVEDYGLGRFLPPLFGRPTGACYWRTPVSPSVRHRIFIWPNLLQEPRSLGAKEIVSQRDDLVWKLPSLGSGAVMAISYQGVRIASYWTTDPVIRALRFAPTGNLFGLLRWLKLPVLNASFKIPMQEAIARAASEFVRGWLGGQNLPEGFVHRQGEQGLDAVVRAFLWNHIEQNDAKMERLAGAFPQSHSESAPHSESDVFKSSVYRLGEICPSLAYNLARTKLRGDKYRKLVRAIVARLLAQVETSDLSQLKNLMIAPCRDCASLVGITPEVLNMAVNAYGDRLDNQASNYEQFDGHLRRLGETSRGRKFLAGALLIRLLEASGL
jgi:hypothetical protein